MLGYILKRIGASILTIWVIITITFVLMHAIPGDPFTREKALSESVQASLQEKYHLDWIGICFFQISIPQDRK